MEDRRGVLRSVVLLSLARAACGASRPGRFSRAALLVPALIAFVAAGLWARARWIRPFDPRDDAAGRVLGDALPGYVSALEADRLASSSTARHSALPAPARRRLGDRGSAQLERMLDAMSELARAESPDVPEAKARFHAQMTAVNAALAQGGLPFFVDTDVLALPDGTARPLVFSFYVQRETEARTDPAGAPVRTVFLWRLDRLAHRQPYLGYTHPRAGAAMVLLDQVERELIDFLLPAMAPGQPILFLYEDRLEDAAQWQSPFCERAGQLVRAHFGSHAPGDRDALAEIGELLVRRFEIVRTWRRELPRHGIELRKPKRLIPEADYATALRHRVPASTLDAWRQVHRRLLEPRLVSAFERARDRFALSMQRHEVQHRLDYERGFVPIPRLLVERLGLSSGLDAHTKSLPARCRDETSAYLAEMADPAGAPPIMLVLLSRLLLDRIHRGTAYECAAQMVFETVAIELGIGDAERARGEQGAPVPAQAAAVFASIAGFSDAELRAAARRAWEKTFEATLPAVASREVASHPSWRH
jgi:hypothetical protein